MFYALLGKGENTIVEETLNVKLGHLMFEPRAKPHITLAFDRELVNLCSNSSVIKGCKSFDTVKKIIRGNVTLLGGTDEIVEQV